MPPMMTTFDQCETTLPCAQRDVTTVPTQALVMLNNEFVHARSEALARRAANAADNLGDQIQTVWKFALGRTPTDWELQVSQQHVKTQAENLQAANMANVQHLALSSLSHVLLNSNEFLHID